MRLTFIACLALFFSACSDGVSPESPRPNGVGLGQSCDAGACRTGLVCSSSQQTCVGAGTTANGEPCLIGPECQSGQCGPNGARGICTDPGTGGRYASCQGDGDCQKGFRCGFDGERLFPSCQPAGSADIAGPCLKDGDCAQGLFCQADTCIALPITQSQAPHGFPPVIPNPSSLWQGAKCPDEKSTDITALWELPRDADPAEVKEDFYRLPYPNDARRGADGRIDFARHPKDPKPVFGFDALGRYLDALATEPFGNYITTFFRFDGPVRFDSLSANGTNPQLRVVDLTTGPRFGQRRGLFYFLSRGRNHYICNNWLAVRPYTGDAYLPGTYAAVLLKGVKDDQNADVKSSPDFTAMLSATAPADARLAAAWPKYQPLRDYLTQQTIAAADVLTATVFTVGDGERLQRQLQQSVAAAPAPTAATWVKCGAGMTSPCPDSSGARACGTSAAFDEFRSLISLPIFQAGDAPYLSPDAGGGIDMGDGGLIAVVRTEQVCAALTVPKTDGGSPDAGWPVLVYAHGTGGAFNSHAGDGAAAALSAFALPDAGADAGTVTGFAVLGFDQVGHGPRRGAIAADAGLSPDDAVYNFQNPAAARGNMSQGAADLHAVVRYLKALDVADAGLPALDTRRLSFWGHSQGATEGALFLSQDRTVEGALLSGASASLLNALRSKKAPINIADNIWLALSESSVDTVNEFHPVLSLLQSWVEPADPINTARHVVVVPADGATPAFGRHVFQVWGKSDTYTAQPVQQAFAGAAGLLWVGPKVDDFLGSPQSFAFANVSSPRPLTGAMRQYEPNGYDGHFVIFRNDQAKDDAVRFIGRAAAGQVPRVP